MLRLLSELWKNFRSLLHEQFYLKRSLGHLEFLLSGLEQLREDLDHVQKLSVVDVNLALVLAHV